MADYAQQQNVSFTPPAPEGNPLQKYFRQAKLYLQLPSGGRYYPPGAIDIPDTGEIPIFPMTAKDELIMKTPDALLNGQATVDVIKNCAPNIKDPWQMPSIDLDAVLIAIRIASYGEDLDITANVPGLDQKREFRVNLNTLLQKFMATTFEDELVVNNMKVKIRPLTYKEFTVTSLKTFEEQRIFQVVNNEKITEQEKLKKFNESFVRLTDMTVAMMNNSVVSITTEDGTQVTNPDFIVEFLNNSERSFYKGILDHLEKQKAKFQIEPMKVRTSEEDQEAGAIKEFEIPVSFDQSNFFG